MKNADNKVFYDEMPVGTLSRDYEKLSGLSESEDVRIARELLEDNWDTIDIILEIGAGEGRVIKGLREIGFQRIIFAIERSYSFFETLKTICLDDGGAVFLQKDVLTDHLPKADLALLMWSTIIEFNQEEQELLIARLLEKTTFVIVDCPDPEVETNETGQEGEDTYITGSWGQTIYGHFPTIDLWPCRIKENVEYLTSSNRKRRQLLLTSK